MKIIHRYLLSSLIRNLILCLMVVVFLFVVFDFFDRIDNILAGEASVVNTMQYFLLRIPLTASLMLPVATMVSVLLTIGIMSKNSEITAMRAAGLKLSWIAAPLFGLGVLLSLGSIVLNETIVPFTQRRAKEIYNMEIRRKDKTGDYSQSDFWWRSSGIFYSVGMFDSRSKTLYDVSKLELSGTFKIDRRVDAREAVWLDPLLGWNMRGVTDYRFVQNNTLDIKTYKSMPLPISEKPSDFYDVKTDASTMSFQELRRFIKKQGANGISTSSYLANLYEKLSFPFINLIAALVVLSFALKPARSGSMAASVLAALIIGFSYYAIHSFSIALGKAELMPPLIAAWTANILMGFVGVVLLLGAEAP